MPAVLTLTLGKCQRRQSGRHASRRWVFTPEERAGEKGAARGRRSGRLPEEQKRVLDFSSRMSPSNPPPFSAGRAGREVPRRLTQIAKRLGAVKTISPRRAMRHQRKTSENDGGRLTAPGAIRLRSGSTKAAPFISPSTGEERGRCEGEKFFARYPSALLDTGGHIEVRRRGQLPQFLRKRHIACRRTTNAKVTTHAKKGFIRSIKGRGASP